MGICSNCRGSKVEIECIPDWDKKNLEKNYIGQTRTFFSDLQPKEDKSQSKFLFMDVSFLHPLDDPYNQYSPLSNVNSDEKLVSQLKDLEWNRVTEFYIPVKLYDPSLRELRGCQGLYGNSCLMTVLSELISKQKDFLQNIFVKKSKELSHDHIYSLYLWINGIKTIVNVDYFFPCTKSPTKWFAFSVPSSGELWLPLVEKALAKVKGSYEAMRYVKPIEAFSAFSEVPCFTIDSTQKDKFKDAQIKKYFVCSTLGNNIEEAETFGLRRNQAYSVKGLLEFDQITLVELENKWGRFDWAGSFSDNCPQWESIPGEEVEKFKENMHNNKCLFYMDYNDFVRYFPETCVYCFDLNSMYYSQKVGQSEINQMTCVKLVCSRKLGMTFICLQQKEPLITRVILAKYLKGEYKIIASEFASKERILIEVRELPEGEYHIFANVHSNKAIEYNVSAYSSSISTFNIPDVQDIPCDYLEMILRDSTANQNISTVLPLISDEDNILKFYQSNNLGFNMIYAENNNPKEVMRIDLEYQYPKEAYNVLSKDISEIKDSLGNSFLTLTVDRKSRKFLLWKQIGQSNTEFRILSNKMSLELYERYLIGKYIKHIGSNELVKNECLYSELELEDDILVIIQNISTSDYLFKFAFQTLQNVTISNKAVLQEFNVPAGNLEFFKLHKTKKMEGEGVNFTFLYSYKKIVTEK